MSQVPAAHAVSCWEGLSCEEEEEEVEEEEVEEEEGPSQLFPGMV